MPTFNLLPTAQPEEFPMILIGNSCLVRVRPPVSEWGDRALRRRPPPPLRPVPRDPHRGHGVRM